MKNGLIVQEEPKSAISEMIRTLRTNLQFMTKSKNQKVILITSTLPGEGKSWVSSNLAVAFAQTNQKVLLIDSDMRKGRQYKIFNASPKPGLSNFLSCISDKKENEEYYKDVNNFIQKTKVDNLFLMVAGSIPPNPSELLLTNKMKETIEDLKEEFDIVIFDGTPSLLVTDAVVLSRLVDSTIIVTEYKKTKKDNLEEVLKNIKHVGGDVAGVVLNKIPVNSKKYEYTYYYGEENKTDNIQEANLEKEAIEEIKEVKKKKVKDKDTEEIIEQIDNYLEQKNKEE